MSPDRLSELMDLAIAEAAKSKPEDSNIHPFVGAVLASSDGTVLETAYRGMNGGGGHAEYNLFEAIEGRNYRLEECTLFVTLEPCIRRGEGKKPCSVRVALSKVGRIFIGTLDPNPQITGRGEMYLSAHTVVERFPFHKQKRLRDLNAEFFAKHQHEHIPAVSSLLLDEDNLGTLSLLKGQREGILQQSMELITGSSGPVWIIAGRLSWLRELQLALVSAAMRGREVIMVCSVPKDDPQDFEYLKCIAAASGVMVKRAQHPFPTRATLVDPDSKNTAMLSIEETPSLHGSFIKSPHEQGMLSAMTMYFKDEAARATETIEPTKPQWRGITDEQIIAALRAGVPAYTNAAITRQAVPPDSLLPLPLALERLKLARLRLLATLIEHEGVPPNALLVGSPWPMISPIIEVQADGSPVVVDGAHRVYSAIERSANTIEVLVVEGANMPLPVTPLPDWNEVKVQTAKLPRESRYRGYTENYYRPIKQALTGLRGS